MTLLAQQRAFYAQIVADDEDAQPSALRHDVYRNNYRAQLLTCLESSFEKTRQWVGTEPFEAAACHHIITSPPTSWTLDAYGQDFDLLLRDLFGEDPEVAELAWLEWAMQAAFAAVDAPVLDPSWLGSVQDWDDVRFRLAPGFQTRSVATNVIGLWQALASGDATPALLTLDKPADLIVWRKQGSPHFRLIEPFEQRALSRIAAGDSFAQMGAAMAQDQDEQAAIAALGTLLGRWLSDELLCQRA